MAIIEGFELPDDLYYYPETMCWARKESEHTVRIGVTAHAAALAGKISNIRVRPVGFELIPGKTFGTMETFKWVGPLKSPVGGKIIEVNDILLNDYNILALSPYQDGWMILVENNESLDQDLAKLLYGDDAVFWQRDEIKKSKDRSITD